jgi:hypothetical protein
MLMNRTTFAFLSILLFGCSRAADAVDLVNKPLSTIDMGYNSNISGDLQQIADDFSLTTLSTMNRVEWYGIDPNYYPSQNFRVRIFTDAGGMPSSTPFYDYTIGTLVGADSGAKVLIYTVAKYSADVPSVSLDAGVKYWLTIASTNSDHWVWSLGIHGPPGNNNYARFGDDASWIGFIGRSTIEFEQAFTLQFVPEPSACLLAAIGLPLLGIRRRS